MRDISIVQLVFRKLRAEKKQHVHSTHKLPNEIGVYDFMTELILMVCNMEKNTN